LNKFEINKLDLEMLRPPDLGPLGLEVLRPPNLVDQQPLIPLTTASGVHIPRMCDPPGMVVGVGMQVVIHVKVL